MCNVWPQRRQASLRGYMGLLCILQAGVTPTSRLAPPTAPAQLLCRTRSTNSCIPDAAASAPTRALRTCRCGSGGCFSRQENASTAFLVCSLITTFTILSSRMVR